MRILLLVASTIAYPLFGAEPTALTINDGQAVTLVGRSSGRQFIVTGTIAGRPTDFTSIARYTIDPVAIAAVDQTGYVTPRAEGRATLTATVGNVTAAVPLTVTSIDRDRPISFTQEVVPILTKLGCNAGGCHGKADGQNGFKLSLFGFEPVDDYESLVKEARGRRVFAAAPANSLLLRKGTGQMAHAGGKKLDAASPFYTMLHRWIAEGCRPDEPKEPPITKIEVFPAERLLGRSSSQQLAVLATHADGRISDVTRLAQFESNASDIATVNSTGTIATKNIPGLAAIMVRYQTHLAVFRATVPLGEAVKNLPASSSKIDTLVADRWHALGLPPSATCDDATFLRRVTLDVAGRLPTKPEADAFLQDNAKDKRAKWIDHLLSSSDYADFFANKWGAILRNRRKSEKDDPKPNIAFRDWLREALATNKPYDQLARELLTAQGAEVQVPPTVWYRELRDATTAMEDVAQLFMGQRLACAKCHHHPMEKWSQHDYWSFAAFFAKFEVKDAKPAKKEKDGTMVPAEPTRVLLKANRVETRNPRTNKVVQPAGLGAEPLTLAIEDDPRTKLADWLVDPANPFFAKSLVNRYWKHFMGRGLVEPEDDMRLSNPPTNPALLDHLAQSFVASKYDLKQLIRSICTSAVYQRSAVPNEYNGDDVQNYSRFYPKRLAAEVLLDAIDDVTLSRTKFKNAPPGTRAVQLPDNVVDSYFLSVFGKPDSASACECERNSGTSLAQALHLFNSQELQGKVAGPRLTDLLKSKRPVAEIVTELYQWALSRRPTDAETQTLVQYITKKGNTPQAYEDAFWAILNTKEFLFNH